MPGYSKSRFTDLNERESDELTCGICLEILRAPVVTKCCRQAYCAQCIAEWFKLHKTCPNDRKNIGRSDLSLAPRLVVNTIGRLRIRCDNYLNGCERIVALASLQDHLNQCEFTPNNICKICDTRIEKDFTHNCVHKLLVINNTLEQQLDRLKSENTELNDRLTVKSKQISDLKIERQNMRKLFETMREDIYALKSANLAKEVESIALRDEFNILRSLFEDTSVGCDDQNQTKTPAIEGLNVKKSRRLSLPLFRSMSSINNNNKNNNNNSGVNQSSSPKNSKANKASKNTSALNPIDNQMRFKSSQTRITISESISEEESVHEIAARNECCLNMKREQNMFELEAMFKEAIKKYD